MRWGPIEAAILDFAAWTGREGVCVPGVQVEEELTYRGETIAGSYRGARERIAVRAGVEDPGGVILHELCHALDRPRSTRGVFR